MILTKLQIKKIDIDHLISEKILNGIIGEVLFIVPTRRKMRYLTRELISLSPNKSVGGLKIETIGSFAEKILVDIEGQVNLLSEEASILLLSHSFTNTKLKYFSQYKDNIPFGTLERVKNIISEYKRHGITPEKLRKESEKLTGGEKLKAIDIAEVYEHYQKSLELNNFKEIGDIYSTLNSVEKKIFSNAFSSVFPDSKLILINGFDEFTSPEVEIINSASGVVKNELFIVLDYFKYNPVVFSHLNACHSRFIDKGFIEVEDISQTSQTKFLDTIRQKLSLKSENNKDDSLSNSVTQISAGSREEEIELIAKQIKKILSTEKAEPERICIVFNLIGNYSAIIRDRFDVYGIPFNLTDRFTLSTSNPVKVIISLLEIIENDYYYKSIFRALGSGYFDSMKIDISNLLKTSVELKIISGYNNWINKIKDAIITKAIEESENYIFNKKLFQYKSAANDLEKIRSSLNTFSVKLTPDEFRNSLFTLIFSFNIPAQLLNSPAGVIENDAIALNSFLKIIDEMTDVLKIEHSSDKKLPLKIFLDQLRTITNFTRYNIPEKPGYGVQVTTLNEIRGLSFDYLFIGGLNDGDFPTRFTPEIFFSGSFAKDEYQHQVEQRYLFYQALCTWKKKLYLSFPQFDNKRELVQSSFLQDFNSLFNTRTISKTDFENGIYSKEELLELLGKITPEQRNKLELPAYYKIDFEETGKAILTEKKRTDDPFGESEYTGNFSKEIPDELKNNLKEISEGEFSATQLENYAKCPYKYFVENILKLESITEPIEELEAFEYGSLIHSILYEFYSKLREKGIVLNNSNNDDFKTAEDMLFKIAERKFDELNLSPELSFYEREKLLGINGIRKQSLLYKFLEDEKYEDGGYVPSFFELSFGNVKDEKFQSSFRKGIIAGNVKLKGKIDRIDINEDEKTLKVIDYKLGGTKPSTEDLSAGISLQLPLYLYAAKELIKTEFNKEYQPADAQIFSLKFAEKDFGKKSILPKSRKAKTETPREDDYAMEKIIKTCLDTVNKFANEISRGKFHLSKLKNRENKVCRFCNFKRICRIQEVN